MRRKEKEINKNTQKILSLSTSTAVREMGNIKWQKKIIKNPGWPR